MTSKIDPVSIRACVFDVFGTVVDWRGSIIAEGESFWRSKGIDIDWGAFADSWRGGYGPAMNKVCNRLNGWPDSSRGLTRLKTRCVISPLSNGNVALLTNMGKFAGLPWDCILGAEIFRHYKPDPEVYLGAAEILGLQPSEVMMCAAHGGDLLAAGRLGLRTAYIYRPLERGPGRTVERADTSK